MITLFENYEKYKVGDYVKIKLIPKYIIALDQFDENNLFAKIAEIENLKYLFNENEKTYRFVTSENKMIFGYIYLIRRKMTKDEIKKYIIREEANKYNI